MIPKYRAWHKELKIMRNVFSMQNIGDEDDLLITTYGVPGNDELYMWSISEIVLMQWTGLSEAQENGRHIYEGDILRFNINGSLMFVKFSLSNGLPRFCGQPISYLTSKWLPNIGHYDLDCSEIIGNIYENPELLDTK